MSADADSAKERDLTQLVESLDALPDALLLLDAHGVVTWASSATSDVLVWAPAELVRRSIAVVALEENIEQHRHLLDEVLRTGRAVAFSAQRRRGDGQIVEVWVSMGPIRDAATGETVGTCASVRRVTPEVRLQTQLTPQDESPRHVRTLLLLGKMESWRVRRSGTRPS
ncbi:PAS domain-containing protein [Nakamurella panacisegetis]|uniref:PAS domain-containing protein n=1 Tax=Nakamurella panacisegetis TaxID=1090615 RepID=UPI0012FE708A|nr:PAS domain-containing protein [Nakamurella panacisegetis]